MEVETAAAAAFINVAIQNVRINFSRKMSPINPVYKNVLRKLSKSLETVQMLLNNEEMTPTVTTEVFTQWLKKLGPVVFDADNVVDELKYHLLSKEINIFKPSTIEAKVLACLPSPILDATERILAPKINEINEIKEINEKLESINKDAGLIRGAMNAPSPTQFIVAGETTVSSFPDPDSVGIDDDVLSLADKLITKATKQEEHVFSILAIWGIDGIGKTTLAKKIFDCESIIAQFGESRIWVHVGQAFDPIILYTKILAAFTSDPAESRDDILKRLQQSFIGKTFLLVLDDVWYHDVVIWEDFLKSLNGVITTKGNAIIITTRDENVAHTVRPFHIYQPKPLSQEECWSIIKNITFGNQDEQPDFEEKGKEIAQRCGPLQLATYLVGGILRGKTQQHWELIAKTLHSQDEQKLTSEIFRLSFQNLSPPSLKMCFAYCSIFPKGHKIVKQELIELWMAQGFLQSNEEADMEAVGDTFSNVLVHNSMLQVAEKDENGNVESFVMHDLLHDLASSVSGSQYNADGLVPVHHLTLEEKSSPVTKEMAKHVRTLFVEGGEMSDNMLSDYPSLRTLSLTRVKELPSSIQKLIHLRNLNISKSCITQLPDWIGELHNLQTLRADTKHLWRLPSTLSYLINLRHLYVLPRIKLPAEMGRLTNLRTLRHFAVGENKGTQIEELKNLNNLQGRIHVSNLENVHNKEEAAEANMHQKQNLSELVFTWSEERNEGEINDERVLEGLQPHPNLKQLEIGGFKGKRFPTWTQKMAVTDGDQGSCVLLNKLIQITLSSCTECEEIPELMHLSNLKSLSLIGLKKVKLMYAHPFSNLTSLYIRGLQILEFLPDWIFKNNPKLSKLEIIECPKLEKLPDDLDTLDSLKELNITDCQNMKSISQYSKGTLSVLRIVGCGKLTELPLQMVKSCATSLEILELFKLESLENLPMVISCVAKSSRLKELKIAYVPEFMTTCSVESWNFGSLQKLHLDFSGESSDDIEQMVNDFLQGCCNSLTQLCLLGKEIWKWVPESIQRMTLLSKLELCNFGIEELPKWFGTLSCLSHLSLSSCNKLKRLLCPETLESLTKLRALDIKVCPALQIGFEGRNTPSLTIKVDDRRIEPYTNEIVDGISKSYLATEFLLKRLGKSFKEEDSGGVEDIKQLQKTLVDIQWYLNDAQNKCIGEEIVKFWLMMLQNVAFDADNVSDELNYIALRNKVKKLELKGKVKVLSLLNHVPRQKRIAPMIKEINEEFRTMILMAKFFGVESKSVTEPDTADDNASSADSFTLDPIFIGRGDDVQKLVEKLTTDFPGNTIFSILAIVGMGGVGKTTLTRAVINHQDVKARYESYVWVHVSRSFDPTMILKNILSALTSETNIGGVETEESILKKLQQALKGKTYILVLDDVCNEDVLKWEKFINSMSGVTSTKGNAIIITTRISKVASLVKPLHTHPLNGLSYEDCWSIIKGKAFPKGDVQPGHEAIGDKIVKRCQGLPFAANILGGVLSGKSGEEWSSITEKWLSYKENVFKMSYDHLPSSSHKMCFAYCSIFPKGCKIAKRELIELWMAEEFLQSNEEADMEAVGDTFSNVLVHNSMLQVAETDENGNVESFVMHDQVHDLASAVLCDDTDQVQYSFRGDESEGTAIHLMRTLIVRGEKLDTTMFSSYKSLHALTLDCDSVRGLPSSIRVLTHLRNLNVSRTRIESLPLWIYELYFLQTLNASTESLRDLPSTLKYLTRLRHLYLCHDVELPAEMGELTKLQGLNFRVRDSKGHRIGELGSLNNLKQLSVYNLENVWSEKEARKANICQKLNLSELSFEWDADIEGERYEDQAVRVLEGLKPHLGLKMLKIAEFKGKKFPSWAQTLRGFDQLTEITLSGCQGCEEIPELGQLPKLKTLRLCRLSKLTSINSQFYGNIVGGDSFPALETLLLKGMSELKVIQNFGDKVKVFPSLVSLKIYSCNKLECLPSWFFVKARGLKEVDIRHCSKLSRLPDDLHTLDCLESVTIKGCQNLMSIVNPESGGRLTSLRSIEIRDCQKLTEMVELNAPLLKKVSMVELKSLQNLSKFLDSLKHSPSLAQLTIVGVPKFVSDIRSWSFQKLRKLEIDATVEWSSESSDSIKETVDSMLKECSSSLGELRLMGLEIWDMVPESIQHLIALYNLELENFGVDKLPKWFEDLTYLKRLCLSNFPMLRHLPSMKRLTELQEFHICNCPEIKIEYECHKLFHRCAIYVNNHLL